MRTSDDVRLRVVHWPNPDAHATVLLFPGRTEYCEKYGRVARDLLAEGYTVVSIDWRGQGLSDRVTEDERVGHVGAFADYQIDVDCLLEKVDALGLPAKQFLLPHSMGACIAMRALVDERIKPERVVFSAPMWGIFIAPIKSPVAWVLPTLAQRFGQELRTVPGTRPDSYIGDAPFLINLLTSDRDHYDYMTRHAEARKEFALGGPTIHWFSQARAEMEALLRAPRPTTPCATFLGTNEFVVDPDAIREMHKDWDSGELHIIEGGKHEMMLETPPIRASFMAGMLSFFATGKVEAPQISI